ncbi:heterokaryon incompatibility protein-domain-containing protein [Astrocystis sublimbata]|nr:heterokaryon incompatibility protein-domain-containing protein [Astrocystis sublimbata]
MLRWHSDRCRTPDVVLVDHLPYCLNCQEVPDCDAAMRSNTANVAPPPQSADRYWWPRSVAYLDDQDFASVTQGTDGVDNSQHELLTGHRMDSLEARPPSSSDKKRSRISHDSPPCETETGYAILHQMYDFRLLCLSQASTGDPLHGCLELTDLALNPTRYEALSYTWADEDGNAEKCDLIFLGPFWDCLPITRNCYLALQRFRKVNSMTVWVDAICINQENTTEQSHQVNIMTEIYSKAERVVVFLGPLRSDLAVAMGQLAKTARLLNEHPAWRPYNELYELGLEKTIVDAQESIKEFFRLRYFTRVWVIQEIAMAREVSIVCGDTSIDLHSLNIQLISDLIKDHIPEWLVRYGIGRPIRPRQLEDFLGLQFLRDHQIDELLAILNLTSRCSASDPRDRIFAILGLVSGAKLDGLVPNYSLSLNQIHLGIAAYLLTKNNLTSILAYPRTRIQTLPSWVPDWSPPRQLLTELYPIDTSTKDDLWLDANTAIAMNPKGTKPLRTAPIVIGQYKAFLPTQSFPHLVPKISSSAGSLSISGWRIAQMCHFQCTDDLVYAQQSSQSPDLRWVVRVQKLVDCSRDEIICIPGCESYLHVRNVPDGNRYELIGCCEIGIRVRPESPMFGYNMTKTYYGYPPRLLDQCLTQSRRPVLLELSNFLLEELETSPLNNRFGLIAQDYLRKSTLQNPDEEKTGEDPAAGSSPLQTAPTRGSSALEAQPFWTCPKELESEEHKLTANKNLEEESREALSEKLHATHNHLSDMVSDSHKSNVEMKVEPGEIIDDSDKRLDSLAIWFEQATWDMVDTIHKDLLKPQSLKVTWHSWLELAKDFIQDLEAVGTDPSVIQLVGANLEFDLPGNVTHKRRQSLNRQTQTLLQQLRDAKDMLCLDRPAIKCIDTELSTDVTINQILVQWLGEYIQSQQDVDAIFQGEMGVVNVRTQVQEHIAFLETIEPSWQEFTERREELERICHCLSTLHSFQQDMTFVESIVIV